MYILAAIYIVCVHYNITKYCFKSVSWKQLFFFLIQCGIKRLDFYLSPKFSILTICLLLSQTEDVINEE